MNEEKWIKVIHNIKMDEEMKQRVYHNCINRRQSYRGKWRYYKPVLISMGIICMFISVPSIGDVTSTMLERMQSIRHEEVEYLDEIIQNREREADGFSRDLTEEEVARRKVLLEDYTYKGTFPEGKIKLVEGWEPELSKTFYYNTKEGIFYLPKRPLSDEELLQMIEFNEKRDYSLQLMNKERKLEENLETTNKTDTNKMEVISQDIALEKAKVTIESIYGVLAEEMESQVEYSEESDKYDITLTNHIKEYSIWIDSINARVKSIFAGSQKDFSHYKIVTKEIAESEKALYEKSKDILENVFYTDQAIQSAWCNYYVGDGGRGQDRKIHYLFELADGSGYIFRYLYEEGLLYEFTYMSSFDGYQTIMKQNDPKLLKRGVIREAFEIPLE